MLKGQKGITLVALVITIIVLLILAGITISLVIGDNGLLNKATGAGQNYVNAANQERNELNHVDNYMGTTINNLNK